MSMGVGCSYLWGHRQCRSWILQPVDMAGLRSITPSTRDDLHLRASLMSLSKENDGAVDHGDL